MMLPSARMRSEGYGSLLCLLFLATALEVHKPSSDISIETCHYVATDKANTGDIFRGCRVQKHKQSNSQTAIV